MSVDYSQQPTSYLLPTLNILPSEMSCLKNGIPILYLHNENQRIIRLDIRLKAGSFFQNKNGIATIVAKALFEGTTQHKRSEIFAIMDYQGAYMESSSGKDFASFSIYMPKQAIKEVLTVVSEVFTSAIFPEEELLLIKEQQKQSLTVNLEKTSVVAFRTFTQQIFPQHPYGTLIYPDDYDTINRDDVLAFFHNFYQAAHCRIFVAGEINDEVKELLNNSLGNIPVRNTLDIKHYSLPEPKTEKIKIPKQDAMQASICIGKRLFTRQHADWEKLNLLNMVLGGYFGSRLMSEVREKKGLAYGIHSQMKSYQVSGAFYISADVNSNKTEEAIEAVYHILTDLQHTAIDKKELTLVKNYYYGVLLRYFDGIFPLLDRYIEVNDYDLPIDYWLDFLETIKNTEADELQALAQTYFQPESMTEIIVG